MFDTRHQQRGIHSGTDRCDEGTVVLIVADYATKLFTPPYLSYREGRNGDVWQIEATRNGAHQCWDGEIMAVVDIVANGKVRVKLTADGLQTEAVAFR